MNTINIKYGLEDIKARVPGLFAYFEFDENEKCTIHPASDSNNGCYGKIPCSIVLPDGVELVVENEIILASRKEYSYRTLMIYYYEYAEVLFDDPFIDFMEKGIGKFGININIDRTECNLVPEYEYYANCARLYDEYEKMSILCQKYLEIKEATGETDCDMECLLDKYKRLGGDVMKNFYHEKIDIANMISDEYLAYVGNSLNLNFDINIVSHENDGGILSTFLVFWYPKGIYNDGDIVIYNDRSYICNTDNTTGEWDARKFDLLSETYDIDSEHCKMAGIADSRLPEFRGLRNYLDEGGDIKTPDSNTDWLWYYRIGTVGYYETTTDELGNIVVNGNRNLVEGEYETHLMAYGDVITDIIRNSEEQTITFEYMVGCNLKAVYRGCKIDDDNNVTYYYGDYEYNEDDSHGIRFTETYYYYDDDIISMTDEEFEQYISFDRGAKDTYKKCPFDISSSLIMNDMIVNGTPKTYVTAVGEFSTQIDTQKDSLVNPTTKFDYLMGITYKPSVKTDVYVNRGNAAAWERHLKLSEIKTFEDMETYANGGFFNIR